MKGGNKVAIYSTGVTEWRLFSVKVQNYQQPFIGLVTPIIWRVPCIIYSRKSVGSGHINPRSGCSLYYIVFFLEERIRIDIISSGTDLLFLVSRIRLFLSDPDPFFMVEFCESGLKMKDLYPKKYILFFISNG